MEPSVSAARSSSEVIPSSASSTGPSPISRRTSSEDAEVDDVDVEDASVLEAAVVSALSEPEFAAEVSAAEVFVDFEAVDELFEALVSSIVESTVSSEALAVSFAFDEEALVSDDLVVEATDTASTIAVTDEDFFASSAKETIPGAVALRVIANAVYIARCLYVYFFKMYSLAFRDRGTVFYIE